MEIEPMVTGPILIREATMEDVPFLKAMNWEAALASPNFIARFGEENLRRHEEEYWSAWQKQPDPAFVALDADGQELGAITLQPNGRDKPVEGWRIAIAVIAQARGQRVGQRLLQRAIAFAEEKGASYVSLFIDPTNSRAIALYHRVGFVKLERPD